MKPYVNIKQMAAALVFSLITSGAVAGESLTYDPDTGIYTMEYYNTYDQPTPVQQRVRFELPTRIEPVIKSKVKEKEPEKELLIYQYEIKNGKASKQDIDVVRIVGTHAYAGNQATPSGWGGSITPRVSANEVLAGWSYEADDVGGIKPGATQRGFGFESRDLPGVGVFESIGNERRDLGGFPDLGPSDDTPVAKQFSELMQNNESVRRFAAAPKIRVPDPFNTAVVLSGIQKHLNQNLISLKLIDPVFASQLDRLLQAAIDAAKLNATQAVRDHLKDLRKLLKKEHADADKEDDESESDPKKVEDKQTPIDKLAAKVLDFDFKYVQKRLPGKQDD
jgi:hypothetical protein